MESIETNAKFIWERIFYAFWCGDKRHKKQTLSLIKILKITFSQIWLNILKFFLGECEWLYTEICKIKIKLVAEFAVVLNKIIWMILDGQVVRCSMIKYKKKNSKLIVSTILWTLLLTRKHCVPFALRMSSFSDPIFLYKIRFRLLFSSFWCFQSSAATQNRPFPNAPFQLPLSSSTLKVKRKSFSLKHLLQK